MNELTQARTLTFQKVKQADEFQFEFIIKAADLTAWRMHMQVL